MQGKRFPSCSEVVPLLKEKRNVQIVSTVVHSILLILRSLNSISCSKASYDVCLNVSNTGHIEDFVTDLWFSAAPNRNLELGCRISLTACLKLNPSFVKRSILSCVLKMFSIFFSTFSFVALDES